MKRPALKVMTAVTKASDSDRRDFCLQCCTYCHFSVVDNQEKEYLCLFFCLFLVMYYDLTVTTNPGIKVCSELTSGRD